MDMKKLVLTKEEIIQAIDRQSEKEGLSRTTIYFYGSEAVSLATVKKAEPLIRKDERERMRQMVMDKYNGAYPEAYQAAIIEIWQALKATEGKEG